MTRKTANDFHPEVLKLFDGYVHGQVSRRDFLLGAGRYAALSGLTASGLLAALSPQFALAQQVKPDDSRINAKYIEMDSPQGNGKIRGYLVTPAKVTAKLPAVLVVHENRGLNPHIEDIARRIALDNFIAFAPDALYTLGGYPGDEDKARELFQKLDQVKTQEDFVVSTQYLKKISDGNGKVGVVGFCYGGGMANYLATRLPDLNAAVPFYGRQAETALVANIKAPLLIHYAGIDERVNAGWPAYEEALKAAKINYQAFIYENTQHGFNNDTTPRYDEKAAALAWKRTIDFFNETLRK
jgi:carboxymethylenebutenolidase